MTPYLCSIRPIQSTSTLLPLSPNLSAAGLSTATPICYPTSLLSDHSYDTFRPTIAAFPTPLSPHNVWRLIRHSNPLFECALALARAFAFGFRLSTALTTIESNARPLHLDPRRHSIFDRLPLQSFIRRPFRGPWHLLPSACCDVPISPPRGPLHFLLCWLAGSLAALPCCASTWLAAVCLAIVTFRLLNWGLNWDSANHFWLAFP